MLRTLLHSRLRQNIEQQEYVLTRELDSTFSEREQELGKYYPIELSQLVNMYVGMPRWQLIYVDDYKSTLLRSDNKEDLDRIEQAINIDNPCFYKEIKVKPYPPLKYRMSDGNSVVTLDTLDFIPKRWLLEFLDYSTVKVVLDEEYVDLGDTVVERGHDILRRYFSKHQDIKFDGRTEEEIVQTLAKIASI